jgi:cytochrome c peroxidase
MRQIVHLSFFFLVFWSCQKQDTVDQVQINTLSINQPATPKHVETTIQHYNSTMPDFLKTVGVREPVINNAQATLGRVLFYDRNLSKDYSVSCATCHQQSKGFSDDQKLSVGINGQLSTRNSMSLVNVANFKTHYQPFNNQTPTLLWDGRAASISEQAPLALLNPHEMDMSWEEIKERVSQQPYYQPIFNSCFGDATVTEERILTALSEFIGAMGSFNSKLDRSLIQLTNTFAGGVVVSSNFDIQNAYYGLPVCGIVPPLPQFTESELRGRTIFAANCTQCHSPIRTFQSVFMANNGLELEYSDPGRQLITNNPADAGVFKSPSLRNIGFSAPYMHDGRFANLREVVDFYSEGVQDHPNLHPLLKQSDGRTGFHFTAEQKADLLAFLATLDDDRFKNDKLSLPKIG